MKPNAAQRRWRGRGRALPLHAAWLLVGSLLLLARPAQAGLFDWGGELRAGGFVSFASSGQLDLCNDPMGGGAALTDGGGLVSATVVGVASAPNFRYQLGLTIGYNGQACTQLLRRVFGGLDFRAEHSLSKRTRITAATRLLLSSFDRTVGVVSVGAGNAGQYFLTGDATLDLEHSPRSNLLLKFSTALRLFQTFDPPDLSERFSTLGPMELFDAGVTVARLFARDRVEGVLHYRVAHFFPALLIDVYRRNTVVPAQSFDGRASWERQFSDRLTLHIDAGVALGIQPHLCVQITPELRALDRCSIDLSQLSVRGPEGAPPVELGLGQFTTLAPVAEISLTYKERRRRVSVSLYRGYDGDPYASALSLVERLSIDMAIRPLWELLIYGNAQVAHLGQTTLARVTDYTEMSPQVVSPQNRTLFLTMGQFGLDYTIKRPLALFAELNFQVLGIRGERVRGSAMGPDPRSELDPAPIVVLQEVSPFPADNDEFRYQKTSRVTVFAGLRVFIEPRAGRREADALATGRAVPTATLDSGVSAQ